MDAIRALRQVLLYINALYRPALTQLERPHGRGNRIAAATVVVEVRHSSQSAFARELIGDVIQSALKPRGNLLDFGCFDDERRCEYQAVAGHA